MGDDEFEQLLDESFAANAGVASGEKLEAEVVSIDKTWVYLDLGARAEGLLPREEVERDGELTVTAGQVLTVLTTGTKDGAVLCALKLGTAGAAARGQDNAEALAALQDACESEMPVEGTVKEVNKGGLTVSVMGQRAFCPVSQIERGYCEDPSVHVGRTHAFLITRVEEGGRNVVLSRRRLLEREAEQQAQEVLATLAVGDVREGTVTSLQKYGAFVDVGGIEGLIHVSELSHTRIGDPSELLEQGQRIQVQVKEIDHVARKIALSLKALSPDPFRDVTADLTSGTVLRGKVTRIAPYGAFVEIAPGVEGLVHVSRLAAGRRVNTPREIVQQGEEIDVLVLEVDTEARRIALERIDEDAEAERQATEEFRRAEKPQQGGGMGTLGDLLADKIKKDR
jgi:small subunit ribosomal protein S1